MTDITVLLVDDHEMVADSLRRVLATADDLDVVGIATTAADATVMAIEQRPDVILLDYLLPDARGTDAARGILAEVDAKILLLTGSDDRDVLFAAIDAGCVGYIQKTNALEELVAAIRAAAAGAVVLSRDQLHLLATAPTSPVPATSELTPREQEILELLGEGLTNQSIALRLALSVNTVRTHVQTVLRKLGAHSKLQAVAISMKRGLLHQP
jgi:DNA-binding NarL/FixJ family response regulator